MAKKLYVILDDGHTIAVANEEEIEAGVAVIWREAKKIVRAFYLQKIAELRQLKEKDIKE